VDDNSNSSRVEVLSNLFATPLHLSKMNRSTSINKEAGPAGIISNRSPEFYFRRVCID